MDALPPAKRRALQTAIAAGRVPNHTKSRTILATGAGPAPNRRAYVVLSDHRGLTPMGAAYYEATQQEAPDRAMDLTQQPTRSGDSEYARDRQGRLVRLRTLLPDGSFKYTLAGRHFYSRRQIEMVVHVPVVIEGRRRNGTGYTHLSYLPTDLANVGRIFVEAGLSPAQRTARVRSFVLDALGVRTQGGRTVLLEISGETWYYDRDRPWLISEMETTPTDHGPQVNVRARQVMAGPVAATAHIPFAEHVIPEAWQEHDDKLCVVRQLAVLTGASEAELCDDFDRLLDRPWRNEGIATDEVLLFCKDKGLPYYCVGDGRLQEAWQPAQPQGKAVAFAYFGGHMYAYKSARCISEWTPLCDDGQKQRLQGEWRGKLPPFSDWRPFEWPPTPGTFHHENLNLVRERLLLSGRNPKIVLRSLPEIGSVRYACVESLDGAKGDCVIRETPPFAHEIAAWLKELGNPVEWCGERLPGIAYKVLLTLMAAARRTPTAAERAEILKRQRDRCALCGGAFDDDLEWDHVAPLRTLTASQKQKFQAVCASCHAEKTGLESGAARALESRFSKSAWDDYVRSPKPPPLVWKPHVGAPVLELDVIRCRRNALACSAHEFSVFCALDSITPAVEGTLGDFSFVTGVRDARKSALSLLPWVGPGWYHRVACEFLLHHGLVHWRDIAYSFSSTGRLPADAFRAPLEAMEKAWKDDLDLPKLSVNSLIGLWATNPESYAVVSSPSEQDASGHWLKRVVSYGEHQIYDFIFRSRRLDNASMRPIHDQVLQTEAVRVAQLVFLAQRCGVPAACITDVKTDAVLLGGFARKRRRILTTIAETKFSDLATLRPNGKLDDYCRMAEHGSADRVFRWRDEAKALEGEYRAPHMEAGAPTLPAMEWSLVDQQHILDGGSCLVLGAPGTGKTYFVRGLVKELRKTRRVDVIAKCHASARNFGEGCVTADHWVRKSVRAGRLGAKTVVIEELSQINCYLWNDIAKAAFLGVQFVLLGDFRQFPSVLDTWCGTSLADDALERSRLLWELAGGCRLLLTDNVRSDAALFDFYVGLGVGTASPRDLSEALEEARLRFPRREGAPDYTLVLSHQTRMAVNKLHNQALKPPEAVFYRAPGGKRGENLAQHMWLYAGQELIGAGGRVRKGLFVTVMSVDEDRVILDDGTTLTREQALASLRLAHAITYASCQGLTLRGRVRLGETAHPAFTLRHLYVGSSRCTAFELLEVC